MTAKQQLLSQLDHEAQTRAPWAATQGAALRGEFGREAQDVVLGQLASEYRAAKAASEAATAEGDLVKAAAQLAEAARIKALVFGVVPMTERK